MITFYLEPCDDGYCITGYDVEGMVSRETYFSLYSARMRLYELEEIGSICLDRTR